MKPKLNQKQMNLVFENRNQTKWHLVKFEVKKINTTMLCNIPSTTGYNPFYFFLRNFNPTAYLPLTFYKREGIVL